MIMPNEMIDILDFIRKLYPIQHQPRPQELVEYDSRQSYEKRATPETFWRQDSIANYLDTKWASELFNRDTYTWLVELRKNKPSKEIGAKVALFANWLFDNRLRMFEALRINTKKEVVYEQADWSE